MRSDVISALQNLRDHDYGHDQPEVSDGDKMPARIAGSDRSEVRAIEDEVYLWCLECGHSIGYCGCGEDAGIDITTIFGHAVDHDYAHEVFGVPDGILSGGDRTDIVYRSVLSRYELHVDVADVTLKNPSPPTPLRVVTLVLWCLECSRSVKTYREDVDPVTLLNEIRFHDFHHGAMERRAKPDTVNGRS